MRLKRGVERESCDFCHRRKIKCDRSSRAKQGHLTCSQCALREAECRLDGSDDIRIRRRQQESTNTATGDVNAREHESVPTRHDSQQVPEVDDRSSLSPNHQPADSSLQRDSLVSSVTPSIKPGLIDMTTSSQDQIPYLPFLDTTPFELCPDSIFFLDHIFATDDGPPLWTNLPSVMTNQQAQTTIAEQYASEQREEQSSPGSPPITARNYWQACNLGSTSFNKALHAYFDFAALCLPVVLEDAFWQDYGACRCSDALVYAIACRGIPFTTVENKWDIQQLLASKFKDAFVAAQNTGTGASLICLDDLEALALMVHFEYEQNSSSLIHGHMEQLFFTHDSLVLLTLRSQIRERNLSTSNPSEVLARADERCKLLYWHVYGLDAFHTLDCNGISRIPDEDDSIAEKLPQHEDGGYLDAMLVLAIIARRIMHTLCNATARRKGIHPKHILSIYDQLDHWRHKGCPTHLQKETCDAAKLTMTIEGEATASIAKSRPENLHSAVLWLLEANLYMQVESYVDRYGIADGATFEAEMVAHRIEYETLRAAREVVEISHWIRRYDIQGVGDMRHSLIDLAPSILRNICAGISFWTCTQGKELLQQHPHRTIRFKVLSNQTDTESAQTTIEEKVINYEETAKMLRDAVATATSHKDTSGVLDRLDKQLGTLREEVEIYRTKAL